MSEVEKLQNLEQRLTQAELQLDEWKNKARKAPVSDKERAQDLVQSSQANLHHAKTQLQQLAKLPDEQRIENLHEVEGAADSIETNFRRLAEMI